MLKKLKPISLILVAGALNFSESVCAETAPIGQISLSTQQSGKVTGIVEDELGSVAGASVVVKGTTNGTITDLNGNFVLEGVPNGSVILVSFIGYATQEVKYTGQPSLRVKLQEDTQALSEVVVTALGMTREKKALGYAMTELKGDELLKSNVVNPVNALQGKVAGVQINMGTGGPQASQRILIRGNTSISNNNQPIFVIDGIIIDNDITKTGGKEERDFGNDIKNLNPDDFESVSVLKGAAATALYGSRASNGVVLITTKKGQKGEGLGISFSHTQQWEKVYSTPSFQNEFGSGMNPVWDLNSDGSENRNITSTPRSWGPRFDGLPFTYNNTFEGIYQPYKNNLKDIYRTGRSNNTNVAISGGTDKSTFRFSFSNRSEDGIWPVNTMDRNSLSINASHDISKIVSVEAGFAYTNLKSKDPIPQGGDASPVYDYVFRVPRFYDTNYWRNNYWSATKDGYNNQDPFYSSYLFSMYENHQIQKEDNYRAYMNVNFELTSWLKLVVKGDMNRLYKKFEDKKMADQPSEFRGSKYELKESQKEQYKLTGMLSANRRFGDFSLNGTLGIERFHEDQSYHNSVTTNGLRVPGLFELNNSVEPATTDAYAKINAKRINSVFGLISADWKGQVFLDITGRNDWSSTLRYLDGSGNVSYFYPSVNGSWLLTQSFRDYLPSTISFAKIRASYAIVGGGTTPYLITSPGTYTYYNLFKDDYYNSGSYAYFKFENDNLGAPDLKPEKQYAVEVGIDYRMFNNRLGFDIAYYKTNTKNQILELAAAPESGVKNRIINAGNIQNAGIEILVSGTPIQTKDWLWDLSVNLTHNKNKIIELTPGVDKYKLDAGGDETEAWATVGGAYGDIYTAYSFKRDDDGNKLLNTNGGWIRSGESTKIGSIQPKLLAGFNSNLTWKNVSFGMVIDARFGGDIFSGSYNYGMANGVLKSTLNGRTQETGGLSRTLDDGRVVYDGMIPDGVFDKGVKNKEGVDISGMSYQEAYDKGLVQAQSAYYYHAYLYDWTNGIREASIHKLSYIALRELSLYWSIPRKWTDKVFVKNANLGFVVRNVGYLYNSLPDNIHPEGLTSNKSAEFREGGGSVYSRNYSVKLSLNF